MALGLVARASVVLSDTINSYYRVLKGTDPDSVAIRLPSGGSFEVRHSGTNAPLLRVTDTGLSGIIQGADIVDGTISSAELADDTIVNADVNSAAAIAVTKLAHVGSGNVLKSNGTTNMAGTIDNGDVNGAANIAIAKLAHVGAGNVLKSNGTTNVAGQVVNADVAPAAAIAYSKLNLASSITSADIVDGTIVNGDVNAAAAIAYSKLALGSSITSADIVDGTIVNGDVNAAAAIAITKLADVGANNVLRSSGAGNVAGKIVTNDMVINTINGDRILDNTIPSVKISGGATIPANSIDSSHIIDGSILGADLAVGSTWKLIATASGTGASGVISFSGFPQTYSELLVYVRGAVIGSGTFITSGINFEATPTASLYFYNRLVSAGSTATVQESLGANGYIFMFGAPTTTTSPTVESVAWVHLSNYTSTTNAKNVLVQGMSMNSSATGGFTTETIAGFFASAAAITLIRVINTIAFWTTGTTAQLLGR